MSGFSQELQELVKASAMRAGFELAGVAAIRKEDFAELAFFEEWIANGYAGEMRYLEARNPEGLLKRAALKNALPWGRSAVVCALNYHSDEPRSIDAAGTRQGWISRYAWAMESKTMEPRTIKPGTTKPETMDPKTVELNREPRHTDYHDAVLSRLKVVESELRRALPPDDALHTRCYVDTGPLVERVYAKYAGLGWIAKNTCLINQKQGSWLFLGVIVTSLEVPEKESAFPELEAPDRCGACTRCIDACPTDALIAPYKMDANLCIAYLTIEKRGAVPEALREKVGRQIFGCDICQDVCPWNRRALVTTKPEFQADTELVNPDLGKLARFSEEEYRQAFRGSPVKRSKYAGFLRNVAMAIGNSGDASLIPEVELLCRNQDPTVAAHAEWARKRLVEGEAQAKVQTGMEKATLPAK